MKKLITTTVLLQILISIFHWSEAFAQVTFEKTYGGAIYDIGNSVEQTADGGYVIAGYTESFGAGFYDFYLIKTDFLGDTLWTKTYGGAGNDFGYSVQQTNDGEYVIAGYTESFGAGLTDVYLIKSNSLGDTLWTRAYGGAVDDRGYSVQQTADGGYVIAGYTRSFGAGSADVYLIKTNSLGNTLWTKTYGGWSGDQGYSVQQTVDGGYVIAGSTRSFGAGGNDAYLIKTDSLGDTLWTKAYGGALNDYGYSVQQTTDGGYVIAGYTYSFGAGNYDFYLIKTDSLGDTLWTRSYGGANDDWGYSVQQTADGGYVIAGYTLSFGTGLSDVYLIKTNSLGDTLWTKTYSRWHSDFCKSVQQTADGGYVIVGETKSFWSWRMGCLFNKNRCQWKYFRRYRHQSEIPNPGSEIKHLSQPLHRKNQHHLHTKRKHFCKHRNCKSVRQKNTNLSQ